MQLLNAAAKMLQPAGTIFDVSPKVFLYKKIPLKIMYVIQVSILRGIHTGRLFLLRLKILYSMVVFKDRHIYGSVLKISWLSCHCL